MNQYLNDILWICIYDLYYILWLIIYTGQDIEIVFECGIIKCINFNSFLTIMPYEDIYGNDRILSKEDMYLLPITFNYRK